MLVAGVIVHGDLQYLQTERALRQLLHEATPQGVSIPRFLHAKDIFHGSRDFDRKAWPAEGRFQLLANVGALARRIRLPIVWGAIDRVAFNRTLLAHHPKLSHSVLKQHCYASAASMAIITAEHYMKTQAPAGEVASVVFELNSEMVKQVKETHQRLREPSSLTDVPADLVRKMLPITRIIDTPSFQEKGEASILQLADYCAFTIKRTLARANRWESLYAPIEAQCMIPVDPKFVGGLAGGRPVPTPGQAI